MKSALAAALLLMSGVAQAAEPDCWPWQLKGQVYDVPEMVSTRYSLLGVWTCTESDGVYTRSIYFTKLEALKIVVQPNKWSKEKADEYAAANPPDAVTLSPAEEAFALEKWRINRAKATVAANGTNNSPRPVYVLNANGSRSASPHATLKVPVGTPCWAERRVANSSFHSLEGITDATGYKWGKFVATCTVVAPLGIN